MAGSAAAASAATPTSCIRREVPLTETAYDRLATIAQNNELGAGMAVAMKDLEIRGAGNVLGVEQSGHVAGVGFDLYVRLVGEAVEAYRAAADGKTVTTAEEPKDVRIDLPVDAHLPPDYIASDRLRLEGYRRLAAAADDAAVDAVVEELIDRYGRAARTGPAAGRGGAAAAAVPRLRHHRGIGPVGGDRAAVADDAAGFRAGAAQADVSRRAATAPPRRRCRCPFRGRAASARRGIRDVELVQMVANLVTALQGKPQQDIGITSASPAATSSEERQAR